MLDNANIDDFIVSPFPYPLPLIQDTIVDDASPVVKEYICDNPENLQSYGMSLYSWRGNGIPNWCTDTRGASLSSQKMADSLSVFFGLWILTFCVPKLQANNSRN
jgi:hypothetical protein